MVNGTKVATTQALTTTTTPLSNEQLLRHAKKMNNLVVYAIAQKYDIGELKALATAKFRKLLWQEEPDDDLPDIIDAVFEIASITDPELRNTALQYCRFYITEIVSDDHLCSIIKDHGELGLHVSRELNANAIESCRQKELEHGKLTTLKRKLASLKKEASKLSKTLSKTLKSRDEASVGAFLKKLKTTFDDAGI